MQGRFKSVLIQEESQVVEGARYIHLNPVWPVRHGGLRLAEVVGEAGMKYQAGAQGEKRFAKALADDLERKRHVSKLKRELSSI